MTNKEKLIEIIQTVFDIQVDAETLASDFFHCHYILPICTSDKSCSECKYHDFWEKEYVENQSNTEIISLYKGMSESMQKAVKDIMLVTQKKGGVKNDEQQGEQK